MNRDPFAQILSGILLVSVLATAGICYWYLQAARNLQIAQLQVIALNRNRAILQSLAQEAMEYGNKNPAIIPILNAAGIRSRADLEKSETTP